MKGLPYLTPVARISVQNIRSAWEGLQKRTVGPTGP
jgi:hypothetical protein